MKEVEKNEIKRLSDRLDAIRHQQADLSLVEAADKYAELEKEKATLETEIERLRSVAEAEQRSAETDEHAAPSRHHQKRAGRYGQAEEKRARTGCRPSDDRAGP